MQFQLHQEKNVSGLKREENRGKECEDHWSCRGAAVAGRRTLILLGNL